MILVKAPLRISYVGGGSDYPSFFSNTPGHVVGATIDKYVYIYANPLSTIAREHIRFSYRETESVQTLDELKHPVLREMLRLTGNSIPLNIGTFSDLPSGVGLGGSSSFAVALAKTLSLTRLSEINKEKAAELAVIVERKILQENGGYQDQYHAAIGGFRQYTFTNSGVSFTDQLLQPESLRYLEARQILIWTGIDRDSHSQAHHTDKRTNTTDVADVAHIANECSRELKSAKTGADAYKILIHYIDLGWKLKQKFSTPLGYGIQELERLARDSGADAVKLCGAGGGGFLLVLGEPPILSFISSQLEKNQTLKFKYDEQGVVELGNF